MKKKKIIIIVILVIAIISGLAIYNSLQEESSNPGYNQTVINNIPTTEIPSGSDEINEDNLESDGTEEENPDLVTGNTGNDDKYILGVTMSTPVYYSQIDSRWKNHSYTAIGDNSQTIGTSGCGPTSAAMVVSSIKGAITPEAMGDLYIRYGFRSAHNGTYRSAFKWTAEYFGIEFKKASSVDEMVELVKQNYYFVVSCGKGLFTGSGHYIVIYGIDGDILKIYDPYLYNGKFDTSSRKGKVTVSGTTVYCSISNFKAYANSTSYHGFLNTNASTPTVDPNTDIPTVTTTKYITAKSGLRVRSGPSTSYSKIRTLSYGSSVIVYEESNGWSRIGDNEWVSNTYLSETNPKSSNTNSSTTFSSYKVKITAKSGLRIRKGPGTSYSRIGIYKYGTTVTIIDESNGWGKTSSGWISLSYTTKTTSSSTTKTTSSSKYSLGRYKVNTSKGLYVRSGPSTSYSIKKIYSNNTIFDTYEIKGSWARTPSGWVYLGYCKLVYKY